MQSNNVTSKTDKLRAIALGIAEVVGDTGRFCWKTARATLVIFAGIILAGLIMADPETHFPRPAACSATACALDCFRHAGVHVCRCLLDSEPATTGGAVI